MEISQSINREYASTTAVGEDGQSLTKQLGLSRENLGGVKEILKFLNTKQSRATKGCLIGAVGASQRAGVRMGGLGAVRMAPRF